jgi:hypothetical protein
MPSTSTTLSKNSRLNIKKKQKLSHPASQLAVELPAFQDIISTTATNLAYNVMPLVSPVLSHPLTASPVTLSTALF